MINQISFYWHSPIREIMSSDFDDPIWLTHCASDGYVSAMHALKVKTKGVRKIAIHLGAAGNAAGSTEVMGSVASVYLEDDLHDFRGAEFNYVNKRCVALIDLAIHKLVRDGYLIGVDIDNISVEISDEMLGRDYVLIKRISGSSSIMRTASLVARYEEGRIVISVVSKGRMGGEKIDLYSTWPSLALVNLSLLECFISNDILCLVVNHDADSLQGKQRFGFKFVDLCDDIEGEIFRRDDRRIELNFRPIDGRW